LRGVGDIRKEGVVWWVIERQIEPALPRPILMGSYAFGGYNIDFIRTISTIDGMILYGSLSLLAAWLEADNKVSDGKGPPDVRLHPPLRAGDCKELCGEDRGTRSPLDFWRIF